MEVIIMSRAKYSAEFKSRIVLAIIQGDKDFNTICSKNNLNPGMVRKWRIEFLKNAHKAFDHEAELKSAQKGEENLQKVNDQMLKTIGQLTLERDFLQSCFRKIGHPVPSIPEYDRQK